MIQYIWDFKEIDLKISQIVKNARRIKTIFKYFDDLSVKLKPQFFHETKITAFTY